LPVSSGSEVKISDRDQTKTISHATPAIQRIQRRRLRRGLSGTAAIVSYRLPSPRMYPHRRHVVSLVKLVSAHFGHLRLFDAGAFIPLPPTIAGARRMR